MRHNDIAVADCGVV